MHAVNAMPAGMLTQQVDLARQQFRVGRYRLASAHDLGVATTVVTKLRAERHMKIKQETNINKKLCQPSYIYNKTNHGREIKRDQIRCISQHHLFSENAYLRCHNAF